MNLWLRCSVLVLLCVICSTGCATRSRTLKRLTPVNRAHAADNNQAAAIANQVETPAAEVRTLENPYTPTDNANAEVAQLAVQAQAAGKEVALDLNTIPGMVAYFVRQKPDRTFTPDDIKLLTSYARELLRQIPNWPTCTEACKQANIMNMLGHGLTCGQPSV